MVLRRREFIGIVFTRPAYWLGGCVEFIITGWRITGWCVDEGSLEALSLLDQRFGLGDVLKFALQEGGSQGGA